MYLGEELWCRNNRAGRGWAGCDIWWHFHCLASGQDLSNLLIVFVLIWKYLFKLQNANISRLLGAVLCSFLYAYFVSSDRSSYSDGGLLYIYGSAQPLFEISSISANIYLVLWCSMMIYDDLWWSLVFYDVLWWSLLFSAVLLCFMMFYDVLWCSMMFYGVLWGSMIFCDNLVL